MHDKQYVRDVAAAFESIARQARAAYQPGMTADQLRDKIDLSAFGERFAHGDPFIKANFDAQMKGSAIDRMWQELSGQWKPEGGWRACQGYAYAAVSGPRHFQTIRKFRPTAVDESAAEWRIDGEAFTRRTT